MNRVLVFVSVFPDGPPVGLGLGLSLDPNWAHC